MTDFFRSKKTQKTALVSTASKRLSVRQHGITAQQPDISLLTIIPFSHGRFSKKISAVFKGFSPFFTANTKIIVQRCSKWQQLQGKAQGLDTYCFTFKIVLL